ncbi:MAG: hypothetical protein PHH83_02965 [Patescibacteria group bacterium]|nr:hypothetical protein [Patescibacteria group bacterium]
MHSEEEYEEIKKENSKLSYYLYACKLISIGVSLILIIIAVSICYTFLDSINKLKIDLECERENWYLAPRDYISLSMGAKNIQISNGLVFIQYKDSLEIRPLKSRDEEYKSIGVSIDKIVRQDWLFRKLKDGRVISYPIREN